MAVSRYRRRADVGLVLAIHYQRETGYLDLGRKKIRTRTPDPKDATAYTWRANAFHSLGYFDRSRVDLNRCLEIDPAYDICRRYIAVIDLFLGHVDVGLARYEAGLQKGYLNADVYFAPSLAARGDRIGALGILALSYPDKPELIGLLFRAITDPAFGNRERLEAIKIVNAGLVNTELAVEAFWILKAYDQIAALPLPETPIIWWLPGDEGWLRSPARKAMMRQWRLPEYWRKHGFPPQCKPLGTADFECR